MDVYFSWLQELTEKSPKRIQFIIKDLTHRRSQKWAPSERSHLDDIMPVLPSPDPEGEPCISDSMLMEKINSIFHTEQSANVQYKLSRLQPDYVPTLIKTIVQHVLSAKAQSITSLATLFLRSASSQDLFLTSAARLGFIMVLEECELESDSIPHLRSLLNSAGLNDLRGADILERVVERQSSQDPINPRAKDIERLSSVMPPGATSIFNAISEALSLPQPIISSEGPVPLSVFEDWLSHITGLQVELACGRRNIQDLRCAVERADADLARQRRDARDLLERMSTQLDESLDDIQKVEQDRDVMIKARNSEQMRRIEVEERLKSQYAEAMALRNDLGQTRGRCSVLEADMCRMRRKLQTQEQVEEDLKQARRRCGELELELQRVKMAEEARAKADMAARNAGREEGRDGMLTEMIQLLHSKRESERRARQAELDRLKEERTDRINRETMAKRKAERAHGVERERARCMKRDEKYRHLGPWTPILAFARFETILLIEEFTKFKFSDSTPLTFEAIPWPVLTKPWTDAYSTSTITAENVRQFFRATALTTARSASHPIPADYRKHLLKQGLLAFHGDKMVPRSSTVEDETLRQQILEAANIVTQTLNELMQSVE
ncbi:hypothetical protein DFH06DRAFT_1407810 [Mycena polygramma]|nr:hypothetical protein DFH06DRAFT_1407810 [Mycena polygramma]